jgi:hypothetical protein
MSENAYLLLLLGYFTLFFIFSYADKIRKAQGESTKWSDDV